MEFQANPEFSIDRCGEIGRELAARARRCGPVLWQHQHYGGKYPGSNRYGVLDDHASPMCTARG
eukprot:1022689-Amphidinium_carterae.1